MAFFPAAGLHRCSPRLLPRPHLCRSPPQSTSPSTALSSTPALPSSPSPVSPRCHLLYDRRPPSSPQAAAHDRSAIDFAVPLPPVPLVFPGRARDHRDDAHLLRRDPATQTSVCAIACDPQSAASADRLSSAATASVPCRGPSPCRRPSVPPRNPKSGIFILSGEVLPPFRCPQSYRPPVRDAATLPELSSLLIATSRARAIPIHRSSTAPCHFHRAGRPHRAAL